MISPALNTQMHPSVGIIILNWNGCEDTLECLQSLARDQYPNKHLIIVDNGSTDNSVASIQQAFPAVEIITTGINLGFTGGNNIGIRRALEAGNEYIYLLNNDTVSDPGALTTLMKTAITTEGFGLLAPAIYYYEEPQTIWFGGSVLDLARGSATHHCPHCPGTAHSPSDLPWTSGCAMLMPADVARKLSGFDERFFLNWEDVELSLRVVQSGWRIGLVPEARIYHKVSRSFRGIGPIGFYYHVRNNLLLLRLHGGKSRYVGSCRVLSLRMRETLRAIRSGQPNGWLQLCMLFRAVWDDLTGRYGPLAAH